MTDEKKTGGHTFLWGFLAGVAGTFVGGFMLEAALRSRRERRQYIELGPDDYVAGLPPAAQGSLDDFGDWR